MMFCYFFFKSVLKAINEQLKRCFVKQKSNLKMGTSEKKT